MSDFSWRLLRMAAERELRAHVDLTVDGMEHIPRSGPVLLVARHVHHLYDGCSVIASIPRRVRIVVTLDWVRQPLGRRVMRVATGTAGWPVVVRAPISEANVQAVALSRNRRAIEQCVSAFRRGEIVLIFPEGYPNVDPGFTPKSGLDEMLPFHDGAARLARLAWRMGIPLAVIPVGFAYQEGPRWQCAVRFGEPARAEGAGSLTSRLEEEVRRLSGLAG